MHNSPLSLSKQTSRSQRPPSAFTLIELLVVISIIAILASLAIPAVQGAIKSARKGEARAMANQIKLAITAYQAEYGIFPTNTKSDSAFISLMMGADTNQNKRGIRFMEIPPKATNASGIVTPAGLYPANERKNYTIVTDTNYDGKIELPGGTNANMSVAVYVQDPGSSNSSKVIGTW